MAYYFGLNRGSTEQPFNVTVSTSGTTGDDVEIVVNTTTITRLDVSRLATVILEYINTGGATGNTTMKL